MSEKSKNTIQRLQKFLSILSKYDIAHVYGHYDDVTVELESGCTVSEEDKKLLNELAAFNNLNPSIWIITH